MNLDDVELTQALRQKIYESSGDMSKLSPTERATYYDAVCQSLGLNPLTKPFDFLNLNGKLRLYALRDCTDQLRKLHSISIYITARERISDIYVVTARAKDRTGREDESTGAVAVGNLKGEALANALMKAETKSKRRVTLSIAGLGMLDEAETEDIPDVARERPGPSVSHPGAEKAVAVHPSRKQLDELDELRRSVGVSNEAFADDMRALLGIGADEPITRRRLLDGMTLAQYEEASATYQSKLKAEVEQEPEEEPTEVPPPPFATKDDVDWATQALEGHEAATFELKALKLAHPNGIPKTELFLLVSRHKDDESTPIKADA